MAANAADAWRRDGGRGDQPTRPPLPPRSLSARRPVPPRERRPGHVTDDVRARVRPPVPGRPAPHGHPGDSVPVRERPVRRGPAAAETRDSRLRGVVAVLAVYLLTLAADGIESVLGNGLGLITTIGLVLSTAIATWLVRRRDLLSVVVCPPLVLAAVATTNLLVAPSVRLSGIKGYALTMGTLLVQSFPGMAVATGAGIVVALLRLAARR